MINIASPDIGPEETAAVNAVLKSGMLAQGPKVAELEAAFATYCSTKFALALNSGTAALHAALFAIGVGPGDEVITTPFTFIATINTILMQNAKPVLVDIETDSFNIDPALIKPAITAKTKALLPIDLYGQPYDYDEVKTLADEHGLKIVEDACQAVGATYKTKKAGQLGDIGCFSLYATKNIMSGEGGLITTDNEAYAMAIKQFRQHGMSASYEYEHLGYNYRMSDLHAAIAVEQLKKADRYATQRNQNAALYNQGLRAIPGLLLPSLKPDRTHVYHQYTVRVTTDFPLTRDQLMQSLREKGIGAGIYYPKPLHLYPHTRQLGYKVGDFPNAERAAAEVLSLPVHPKVSSDDIVLVIAAVKDAAHGK